MRRFVRPTLICAAVELEAQALAHALELPALSSLAVPAFGAGGVRVAVIGLRAGLLSTRWAALLTGLADPLVISAGVCGGTYSPAPSSSPGAGRARRSSLPFAVNGSAARKTHAAGTM